MKKMRINKVEFKKAFTKIKAIIYGLTFFSLSFSFISGYFASQTRDEKESEHIAKVVTNNVPTKDLLSISLENKGNGSLPDSETEFRQLYGVFRQEKITFASGYNLTKENTIFIDEIDEKNNLSAVYIGSTTGSTKYKDHYKDTTYPVELMFPLVRYDPVSMQTAIISKRQADILLSKRMPKIVLGTNGHSLEEYSSLLGTPLEITVANIKRTFVIQDVFYDDTYYPVGLQHTVGDFFFTSYYFPSEIKKQNAYFMCEYPYENAFFMKYIKNVYGDGSFNIKCIKQLIPGDVDDERIVSFFNADSSTHDSLSVLFLIVSIGLLLLSSIIAYFDRKNANFVFLTMQILISFIPFLLFKTIYSLTYEVAFFSSYGCKANTILVLSSLILFVVIFLFKNKKITKSEHSNVSHYEVYL